jgi:hypothetical protein
MTDEERREADALLSRLETAIGQLPDRDGANAALITELIAAAGGLRSLLGIVRSH